MLPTKLWMVTADGAKKDFFKKRAGHAAGAKNVEKIIKDAHDMGIEYITMYAFN